MSLLINDVLRKFNNPSIQRKTLLSTLLVIVVLHRCIAFSYDVMQGMISKDTFKLSATWKFQTGDSVAWSGNDYKDNHWAELRVGKTWESQGHNYNGKAWYRQQVFIPQSLKKQLHKNYPAVMLHLGKIDDADEVYFNGKLIGKTGSMEKNNGMSGRYTRVYDIPASLVEFGSFNTIAVRVHDFVGTGGMYEGPYCMMPKSKYDEIVVTASLEAGDGVFKKGSPVQLTLTFENNGEEVIQGRLSWRIFHDTGEPLTSHTDMISVYPKGSMDINFSVTLDSAGFYYSNLLFNDENVSFKFDTLIRFGYDATGINTGITRPRDFEMFWKETIASLGAVPPQYRMKRIDSLSTDNRLVYLVEMRSLDNVRVKGWYTVPASPGPHPAILKTQGYSSPNHPQLGLPDFAVFSLNIRGHGNSTDDLNPGFPAFTTYGLPHKERYIYRGAYMDCMRAVDFLSSRDEVDTTRIAVEGDSQGGGLALAIAALDERIDLCVPGVPYLSDFRTYLEINEGTAFRKYLSDPGNSLEALLAVLDYYDVRNMAAWIGCPVYMSVGLQDLVCPPHINFAAYNNVGSADKEFVVYPEVAHRVWEVQNKRDIEWIRKKFNMTAH